MGNKWIFNPSSDEVLKLGDTMVVLGTEEQVELLRSISEEKEKGNTSH